MESGLTIRGQAIILREKSLRSCSVAHRRRLSEVVSFRITHFRYDRRKLLHYLKLKRGISATPFPEKLHVLADIRFSY